jgi:branched-chain amino acid transport system permease protein
MFGYAGLLPFGIAALFGVGAYCTALILNHFPGIPLLLVLLSASLSGFLAAVIIGFFCVRLSGAYFALTTLAFQMFLFAVALKWRSLTRGDDGMGVVRPELYLPALGSISLRGTDSIYYFTLIIVTLAILACYIFLKTPLGNSVMCVRENETRASFLGYNVFLVKLTVFSVSGVLVGLSGGLFVLFQEFVATTCIDMNMGLTPVLMTIIGGSGHFFGPILGAAFYIVFQDWISSMTYYWMLIMGGVFILTVLYLQGGLISLFDLKKLRHLHFRGNR